MPPFTIKYVSPQKFVIGNKPFITVSMIACICGILNTIPYFVDRNRTARLNRDALAIANASLLIKEFFLHPLLLFQPF